jgi:hypothetical protein
MCYILSYLPPARLVVGNVDSLKRNAPEADFDGLHYTVYLSRI